MAEFRRYSMNGVNVQATGRRSSNRDDKKYERTVRYNDSERVVHYGDPSMEMQRDNPERRQAFLDRHSCSDKTDPFAPGFWACYDWKNTDEGKDMDADEIIVTEDEQTTITDADAAKAGRMLSQTNASAIMDAVRQLLVVLERAGVSIAADETPMTEETLKAMLVSPDRPVAYGSAIKALGNGRFGGYGVVYGSEEQRDTDGEYFTKETNYALDWFEKRPLIYAHGLDGEVKTMPFGIVDSIKQDDVGLYAEGEFIDPDTVKEWGEKQRRIHKWYLGEIKRMMDEGMLYYSSGSVKHLVTAVDGRIDEWPIIELSMTPAPAFPPIYSKTTTIQAFKSLTVPLNTAGADADTEPEEPTAKEANVEADAPVVDSVAPEAVENESQIETEQPDTGETEDMDVNQVLNAVEAALGITLTEEQRAQVMQALEGDMPSEEAMATMDAEQAKAFAQKAIAAVGQIVSGQKATNGVVDAIKGLVNAAQPQSQVNGNGYTGNGQVTVSDRRYRGLSVKDMVFGAEVMAAAKRVDETFLRATAAKLYKAMEKGEYETLADEMTTVPGSGDERPFKTYMRDLSEGADIKANEIIATNLTTTGSYWVGTAYSDQLWAASRNPVVYQNLRSKGMMELEVPQGHSSIYIPTEGTDPTWYTMIELNDETSDERAPVVVKGSTPTLNRQQLTPAGLGARVRWTDFMDEDSLITLLPHYRSRMEITAAETLESVILNGDTDTSASTNINLIDDTPSTDAKGRGPSYLAFNGLMKLALVTTSALSRSAGGALVSDDYLQTVALLGTADQSDYDRLMFLVDPYTYISTTRLADVKTAAELGNAGTIMTGRLPQVWGIDIFRSGQMAKANSAGKIPAAGGTLGRIVCVRPDQWVIGYKRQVTTEVARDIEGGATVVVSTMRVAIQSRTTTGGVAVSYNVGVS